INREGRERARKERGEYRLRDLSSANEAERSADYVTTTFLDDELRADAQTIVSCLKSRDNGHFSPFRADIDWNTRRLSSSGGLTREQEELDAIAEVLNFV